MDWVWFRADLVETEVEMEMEKAEREGRMEWLSMMSRCVHLKVG